MQECNRSSNKGLSKHFELLHAQRTVLLLLLRDSANVRRVRVCRSGKYRGVKRGEDAGVVVGDHEARALQQ